MEIGEESEVGDGTSAGEQRERFYRWSGDGIRYNHHPSRQIARIILALTFDLYFPKFIGVCCDRLHCRAHQRYYSKLVSERSILHIFHITLKCTSNLPSFINSPPPDIKEKWGKIRAIGGMAPSAEKEAATKKWFEEGEFKNWLVKLESSLPEEVPTSVKNCLRIHESFYLLNILICMKLYLIFNLIG